jgi:hypothetical protein
MLPTHNEQLSIVIYGTVGFDAQVCHAYAHSRRHPQL